MFLWIQRSEYRMWQYFWFWLVSHWESGWETKLNRDRKSVNGTSLQDGCCLAIISLKHVNYSGRCYASLISSSQKSQKNISVLSQLLPCESFNVIINKARLLSNYLFLTLFPVPWAQTEVLLVAIWEAVRVCIDQGSHGHRKHGNIRELWFAIMQMNDNFQISN